MRLLHLVATIAVLIDRAHAGDIAITVDQSVTKGGTLDLRWTSDSPTYTVRILLNKHEYKEEKSIAEAEYHWQAEDVKVGDKVQIWVYDSAGNSGKTAFLPVVEGFPEQDDSMSSGTGTWTAPGTNTRTSDHTPVDGATWSGQGESWSSSTSSGTGSLATATGSDATGSPPSNSASSHPSSSAPSTSTSGSAPSNAVATSALEENESATTSATTSVATTSTTSASSTDGADADADTDATTTNTESLSTRMALYIGIGAVVLAVIIGVAVFLWWRQRNKATTAGPAGDREKGQYAQGKGYDSQDERDGGMSQRSLAKNTRRQTTYDSDEAFGSDYSSVSSASSDSQVAVKGRRKRR